MGHNAIAACAQGCQVQVTNGRYLCARLAERPWSGNSRSYDLTRMRSWDLRFERENYNHSTVQWRSSTCCKRSVRSILLHVQLRWTSSVLRKALRWGWLWADTRASFREGIPFCPKFHRSEQLACSFECSFRWFPVRILCQALATAQWLCLVLRVFRFSPCRNKPFLLPFYWTRQWWYIDAEHRSKEQCFLDEKSLPTYYATYMRIY